MPCLPALKNVLQASKANNHKKQEDDIQLIHQIIQSVITDMDPRAESWPIKRNIALISI